MRNFLQNTIRAFLNFIGGTFRFAFGTLFRKIFNMKTYSFKECLNGSLENGTESKEVQRDNEFIGLIFFLFIYLFCYIVVF
jgi:hypothetical protein